MAKRSKKIKTSKKVAMILILFLILVMTGYNTFNYYKNKEKNEQIENINTQKESAKQEIAKPKEEEKEEKVQENKTATELFAKYYPQAEETVATMSLEDKVGQLFWVRCPEKDQISIIQQLKPAGYILFGRDFSKKSKKTVISNINSYQKASTIPLLIGVDEEGGSVVRVSANTSLAKTKFKSPQELYKIGGYEAITKDTKEKAKLLLELGINVNLAPISDVSTNSKDFIYPRSFGKEGSATGKYVKTVVEAMNEEKIGATLKHFPGYGNNIDTHTDVAHDNRAYTVFEESDFFPFKEGIKAGAGSILVSHNIVACMDKERPASLSPKVHKILKEELNYTGIVMTDDLAMEAITKYTNGEQAAVLAIKAGNDLLITTDFKSQKESVIAAVKRGEIREAEIAEHAKKVIAWKYALGLI